MNLGPDNTKKSGAGSEGRGNAVVKKTTSFCSLTYITPDRFGYCTCITCGDWELSSDGFECMKTKSRS